MRVAAGGECECRGVAMRAALYLQRVGHGQADVPRVTVSAQHSEQGRGQHHRRHQDVQVELKPPATRKQQFVKRSDLAVRRYRLVSRETSVRIRFGSPFSSKVAVCGRHPVTLSLTINETLKWLSLLPILMQESLFWW